MKQDRFVILPKKENGELLQKYEVLIYVCIRRYMNKDTMEAYPSLNTIARDSGCSKPTVRKTIDSIRKKGYFQTVINGRFTKYIFSNEKSFEPFSYEFLDRKDLSKSEKLQILCTQQYMYKNNGIGKISMSDRELAEISGLDRRTISRNNKSLIANGFANQVDLQSRDEAGLFRKETIYYLDKLGQAIIFALQKHENDINTLKEENAAMAKDIALLTKQLTKLTQQLNIKTDVEFDF